MQPTLVLSASHPGILYINGHFAGELSADLPLMRPIGSQGPVYLDYRPLSNACLPMARRLVFSGGAPIAESIEGAENLNAVIWPGNAVEIEFSPELRTEASHRFQLAGHSFTLEPDSLRLLCDGHYLSTLPDGAEVPEFHRMQDGAALVGRCRDGKYLLTADEAFHAQTGFLRARQLDVETDGRIRAVAAPADLVGHATLETWKLAPEGLMLISSEPAWAHGAPRWPKTPVETARAAVEAALTGLDAEAERYLSPTLRSRMPLAGINDKCDLCVEMKYAPPNPRPSVGLLRLEGDRLARVQPLYFRASPSGGPQGPYLIDEMEFE